MKEPIFRIQLDGFTVTLSDAYAKLRRLRSQVRRSFAARPNLPRGMRRAACGSRPESSVPESQLVSSRGTQVDRVAQGLPAEDPAGGVWVPPESFERSTTKYWVRTADLMRVKTTIVQHIPVLIFGR